jgi:hypothetical protein
MQVKYKIEREDKLDRVVFSGPLNENLGNNLANLHREVGKVVTFVLKDIDYINSIGIRCWLEFLRNFEEGRTLVYEECAPDVISQINMMPLIAGKAKVVSFYGTMACSECDEEHVKLFKTADGRAKLAEQAKTQNCPKCKATMELEEDPESFFNFLGN